MTTSTTAQSKSAFGQFVQTKRHHAGLTQRELAGRLFVTESAVSKWERGLSYPDISLVVSLATVLGVSEGELINASDDHQARIVESEAQTYRRWRGTLKWATIGAYTMALLAGFIVNLSVEHTLTWFWVVFTAVVTAFSLTTLPLLVPRRHRGWITLGAFLISLFSLLGVVRLLYGGTFFTVAVTSVLFAVILVFLPIAVHQARLPGTLRRHRTALVLGANSLALLLFLFIVLASTHNLHAYVPVALPVAVTGLAFVWIVTLVIRYLPILGLYRAAIVVALTGAFVWIAGPVFNALASGTKADFERVDFGTWTVPYIGGNVAMLVLLACLVASAVLCVMAIIRHSRDKSTGTTPQLLGDAT
jgi:transcriptional regulator with XRE-family HTH domain